MEEGFLMCFVRGGGLDQVTCRDPFHFQSALTFFFLLFFQLDCGIHPGLEGMDALPYIDLIDPAEIDLLLISQ